MSAGEREALVKAKENADAAYADYRERVDSEGKAWAALGYGKVEKFDPRDLIGVVKDNWKSISAVGAAFGVPLAAADVGAFKTVVGLFKSLLPF